MKNKIIYYSTLVLITVLTIVLFKTPPMELKTTIAKKTQQLVSNTTVSPQRLFIQAWRDSKNQYYDPQMNGQNWLKWKEHYLPYIKTNEDVYIAVNSMLQSLNDPHSRFMDISEFENQNINIESNISGIGISITEIKGKIVIAGTIDNSPAQKANLLPGDTILQINGKNLNKISLIETINLIRGDKNSTVTLTVKRKNNIFTKSLKRDIVNIKSVYSKKLENGMGYIQVVSFMGKNVPMEFKKALEEQKQSRALIIDLRGDAGGLLTNAITIANMFIKKGTIVNVVYRNGIKIPIPAQKMSTIKERPIAILINSRTASASEVLAGTLRDNINATIIGESSYGKNSIQQIIPLPNKTGMNLTIAKYIMPSGEDIHLRGIKPNYYIDYTRENYVKNQDPQLDKAKMFLKNELLASNK